jgi:hypothetical protein
MRDDDLAAAEKAGVHRQRSRAEQHEGSGIRCHDQSSQAIEQRTRSGVDGARRDPGGAQAGNRASAGREKSDHERCAGQDSRNGQQPRRGAPVRGRGKIRSPLRRGRAAHDRTKQEQPGTGPAAGERAEEALQAVTSWSMAFDMFERLPKRTERTAGANP